MTVPAKMAGMSMQYVGSLSVIDRGDQPAQEVMDRNERSKSQRIADETKEELEKVMTRVENVNMFKTNVHEH